MRLVANQIRCLGHPLCDAKNVILTSLFAPAIGTGTNLLEIANGHLLSK